MSKLLTTTRVAFTEDQHEKVDPSLEKHVKVISHDKRSDEVVLDLGHTAFTVKADHLIKAINNATNQPS